METVLAWRLAAHQPKNAPKGGAARLIIGKEYRIKWLGKDEPSWERAEDLRVTHKLYGILEAYQAQKPEPEATDPTFAPPPPPVLARPPGRFPSQPAIPL